jgi:hypothetical protein
VQGLSPKERQCNYDVSYLLKFVEKLKSFESKYLQHEVKEFNLTHLKGLPFMQANCMAECRQVNLI